jgi:hypothetical protein
LGVIRQYRKESRAAQENADGAIALSAEYGLTDWLAWATIPPRLGKPKEGRNEEGIAQIREGLAAYRATGAGLNRPYFLTLQAEAYM